MGRIAGQGSKWIRPERRLALYLRDGMACCYCGASVEDGALLTLDHIRPSSRGGSNEASNLVTCCRRCNSARGTRPVTEFAAAVAEYLGHGTTGVEIVAHVAKVRRRAVPLDEAKSLIARRGSVAAVIGE
jgi:hypothetical protein